jgi:preprotein translocase subunit SecG
MQEMFMNKHPYISIGLFLLCLIIFIIASSYAYHNKRKIH